MTRPYFSVKHVESMSLLPEELTPGRIYFIDDEQVIVIDHGNGLPPVIYGGKPGPQGASGEPQPFLQQEIDTLAQTELAMQSLIWDEGKKFRDALARISEHFTETFDHLQEMSNTNSQAIMNLSETIKRSFDNYDNAIATLGKAVSNLYPDYSQSDDDDTPTPIPDTINTVAQNVNDGDNVSFNGEKFTVSNYGITPKGAITMTLQSQGAFSDNSDPLDNETVKINDDTYTIQQTNSSDGSTILDLTQQQPLAQTLSDGDTVNVNGQDLTISGYTRNSDGSISLNLS